MAETEFILIYRDEDGRIVMRGLAVNEMTREWPFDSAKDLTPGALTLTQQDLWFLPVTGDLVESTSRSYRPTQTVIRPAPEAESYVIWEFLSGLENDPDACGAFHADLLKHHLKHEITHPPDPTVWRPLRLGLLDG